VDSTGQSDLPFTPVAESEEAATSEAIPNEGTEPHLAAIQQPGHAEAQPQTAGIKIEAAPSDTAPVRGADGGRTQSEAARGSTQESPEKAGGLNPCECGCGEYPKDPKSRFLPGHDLGKAYSDQKPPPAS